MSSEMNMNELNQVAGGKAKNGKYYTTEPDGWAPYQIKSGDFLRGLAADYGTSVSQIMAHNPLIDNPNMIVEGFYILLPKK